MIMRKRKIIEKLEKDYVEISKRHSRLQSDKAVKDYILEFLSDIYDSSKVIEELRLDIKYNISKKYNLKYKD